MNVFARCVMTCTAGSSRRKLRFIRLVEFSLDAEDQRDVLPRDVAAAQPECNRNIESGERARESHFQANRRARPETRSPAFRRRRCRALHPACPPRAIATAFGRSGKASLPTSSIKSSLPSVCGSQRVPISDTRMLRHRRKACRSRNQVSRCAGLFRCAKAVRDSVQDTCA